MGGGTWVLGRTTARRPHRSTASVGCRVNRITGGETAKFEFASPEDLDELAGALRSLVSDAIRLGLELKFEGFSEDDELR